MHIDDDISRDDNVTKNITQVLADISKIHLKFLGHNEEIGPIECKDITGHLESKRYID